MPSAEKREAMEAFVVALAEERHRDLTVAGSKSARRAHWNTNEAAHALSAIIEREKQPSVEEKREGDDPGFVCRGCGQVYICACQSPKPTPPRETAEGLLCDALRRVPMGSQSIIYIERALTLIRAEHERVKRALAILRADHSGAPMKDCAGCEAIAILQGKEGRP